jgi:hypothetical protein
MPVFRIDINKSPPSFQQNEYYVTRILHIADLQLCRLKTKKNTIYCGIFFLTHNLY